MNEPLQVDVRGVVKRFGDRQVLDGVDLTILPGQTMALIGPSGGGKSTLLRCINGLTQFDAGEIQVGPYRLAGGRQSPPRDTVHRIRRLFGMIFQDFQLFPHLTAVGNVMEAPVHVLGVSAAEARQRAMQLLTRVGLGDRADAYPRELSGGQKQRVAIARALAMEPRGLLCDEITSALDPELKHEVLGVLEDLKQDGLALIVVTHELGFARRTADRIVVLDGGKVIEEGPPEQVLDRPRSERLRRFFRQVLA
jgi:polar amino acid transport system ATP-binding protein